MIVCPKFLHIRNSSNGDEPFSDRIILKNATSFGFTEFKSNISKPLSIQCLFCSEFKLPVCEEQWFDKDATIQICNAIQSNFHLCLQLSENNNKLYVYFQKRSKIEEVDVDTVLSELEVIYKMNGDATDNICVSMLLCGEPAYGTSIIADKRTEFKKKFKESKISFYMKDIPTLATTLTFSEKKFNPCSLNIEPS